MRAYRFVPSHIREGPGITADGRAYVRSAAYTHVTDRELHAGDLIDGPFLGFERWEVLEVRGDGGPLLASYDKNGQPLAVAGTIVCRGLDPLPM